MGSTGSNLRQVFDFIEARKQELFDSPDLTRAREVQPGDHALPIPVHRKFDWLPGFIHLSMTFRDINLFYLRYENPASDYERAINAHVDEDSTHWRLMLHDIKALGYDEPQPISDAVATIWNERSAPARKYMYSVMYRAMECGDDPFLRISSMQANESTVDLLFGISKMHARYFEEHTGVRLDYVGDKHADSEADHALDLGLFLDVDVPAETVAKGIALAEAHFTAFREFLDFKLGEFLDVTRDLDEHLARWPEPKVRPAFRLAAERADSGAPVASPDA